jgi:hypothetical protein
MKLLKVEQQMEGLATGLAAKLSDNEQENELAKSLKEIEVCY